MHAQVINQVDLDSGSFLANGNTVTITGTNLGTSGSVLSATYGPDGSTTKYGPVSCSVVTLGTVVRCTIGLGVGTDLKFVITVDSVASSASSDSYSFAAPTITGITTSLTLATGGGTTAIIAGDHFGPSPHTDLIVTYGPSVALVTSEDLNQFSA